MAQFRLSVKALRILSLLVGLALPQFCSPRLRKMALLLARRARDEDELETALITQANTEPHALLRMYVCMYKRPTGHNSRDLTW